MTTGAAGSSAASRTPHRRCSRGRPARARRRPDTGPGGSPNSIVPSMSKLTRMRGPLGTGGHGEERTRPRVWRTRGARPTACWIVGEHRQGAADTELGRVLERLDRRPHRARRRDLAGEEPAGEDRGHDGQDDAEHRREVDAVDERGAGDGGEGVGGRTGKLVGGGAARRPARTAPRRAPRPGVCCAASCKRLEYCDAAMLPSTATPSAAPSSRVASFIAEPAPARRSGHRRHDRRGHRRHRQRDAGHERGRARARMYQ